MNRNRFFTSFVALAATALLAACGQDGLTSGEPPAPQAGFGQRDGGAAAPRTYQVTIENLTGGQPLTPPLVATHQRAVGFFDVGAPASLGIREIAENGNLQPMLDRLNGSDHVSDVVVAVAGSPPPLMPGMTVTFDIDAEPGARFLSYASMLICTNDGFTGVDSRRLPSKVGQEIMFYTDAYDAGSEINTEDFADIVPPCPPLTGVPSSDPGTGMSDPALAENGVIHHHAGIQGGDDLQPAVHGWTNPVSKITIRRVS